MQKEGLAQFKLPDEPGVYLWRKGSLKRPGKILYIGKAASLRDRVRSYFASDLVESRGERIRGMVEEASVLTWETCDSVLEALILEANLIKRHQPRYNVDQKDNKSFNYLVITKEDFPRVLLVRGRDLYSAGGGPSFRGQNLTFRKLFGPFPQGGSLAEALKIVRKIFPYRDKCVPCEAQIEKSRGRTSRKPEESRGRTSRKCKSCFNRQIGLCPGVCSGEVGKEEYANTVRNIEKLFSGNMQGLKRQLGRDMKIASKAERYEASARLNRQIDALTHIRDISLLKAEHRIAPGGGARVEAYDVAHTGGSETVGVMTVIENGDLYKGAYRMFKIRSATNNDVAALEEMLERRLTHPEWNLPRVFVVDGGIAQLRAAGRILKAAGVLVPVVGVVKNEYHKPERLIGDKRAIEAYERDILFANNEAHRFAISYHRKRRGKLY